MSGNTRNRGARWYKSERNDWKCCVWKVTLGAERGPSWVSRPKRHRAGYLGNQGVVESAPVEGQSKLPASNSDSDIESFRNIRSSVVTDDIKDWRLYDDIGKLFRTRIAYTRKDTVGLYDDRLRRRTSISNIHIYMSEMKEYWNLPFGTLGRPLVL